MTRREPAGVGPHPKADLKRSLDSYRARQGEFRVLDVADATYLMVDGRGDPNGSEYASALEALYPVAYAVKFASRNELGRDHVVMPLEALWWAEDMASFTSARDKTAWDWTAMIMVPDWIAGPMVDEAKVTVSRRRRPERLADVRFETLSEGLCVQTLHVGSYDDEGPVLETMHDRHIASAGLRLAGRHHEIYLSNPRRVDAAKLRTILRQPVEADRSMPSPRATR